MLGENSLQRRKRVERDYLHRYIRDFSVFSGLHRRDRLVFVAEEINLTFGLPDCPTRMALSYKFRVGYMTICNDVIILKQYGAIPGGY